MRTSLFAMAFVIATPTWGQTVAPAPADTSDVNPADTNPNDIIVTGTVYRGEVSSGGARIDAEVRDLPLSISVVTKELADDRQIRNVRELADNVAGVQSRSSGASAYGIDFSIRGFQGFGTGASYNGYRTDGYSPGRDLQNVERVEFLKGPASVLYGASSALSGLANVVTKTPQKDAFLIAEITGGEYGYARTTVDANAPIADGLYARINGAVTVENSLNTFTNLSSQFIAPSLRWTPAPGVSILGEFSYFHGIQPTRGAESRNNYRVLLDLPLRFKISEPTDHNINDTYMYRLEATWEVAPGLTLRQGLFLDQAYEDERAISPGFNDLLFISPNVIARSEGSGTGDVRDFSSQSELRWTVQLGPTRHKLLIGYEHSKQDFGYAYNSTVRTTDLNLLNPIYGAPPVADIYEGEGATNTKVDAGYIQDFIEIGDHWKVLAGIRYDATVADYLSCNVPGCAKSGDATVNGSLGAARENAWSPRLGLVWQPTDRTTLYASWSNSFAAQPYADRNGNLLPPERGIQYEAGIRQEWLDQRRLTMTLAVYDLTRKNVLETDPVDDRFSVAVGEQRAKGFEAELAGKPKPWIDLLAAYSYIHGKVIRSDFAVTGIPEGIQLPEVPHHTASVFTKVALDPIGMADTAFSIGAYYTGNRPARDFFDTLNDPAADQKVRRFASTIRIDIGLYQTISKALRLQANITNLFDRKIFEPVNIGSHRASPFRATVSARVTL